MKAYKIDAIEQKFFDGLFGAASSRAPYVWGGKGDRIWTASGIIENPYGSDVFDCSGLVTTMLFRAGGPDLRFTHGAKQLRELFPPAMDPDEEILCRFYPGHVAVQLSYRVTSVIEAAGGDHTTLHPTPNGYVRCNRERRSDFSEARSLTAYLAALP